MFLATVDDAVNLVIVDLRVPKFDGVKLLRMLKEKGCSRNLVVMSGFDDRMLETTEALAREHGFNVSGRLKKPFLPAELDAVLRTHSHLNEVVNLDSRTTPQISKSELVEALDCDAFELHFQPQIEVSSGKVSGFEALARLRHPSQGLIYPDRFIPLAEDQGLIDRLGWFVAQKSFLAMSPIAEALGSPPMMSINIAVQSLSDLELPDKFLELACQCDIRASSVTLEITESGRMRELARLMEILTRLRVNGFHLSIDDFGTGYAMMQQLQTIPATEIKVDKQFVQQMGNAESSRVVVQKTIDLGHDLGIRVVAEGVESNEQLDFLREKKCDFVQGYLFCRPLALHDLIAWLHSRSNK